MHITPNCVYFSEVEFRDESHLHKSQLLNTEINKNSPSLTQLKKSGFIIKLEPLKRKFVGRADTHRIGFKALAQ
jgi:hypothetical protein